MPMATKMASPIKIKTGIKNANPFPISIIEKLKSPCSAVAKKSPANKSLPLFLVRRKDKAIKYPKRPEHRACRKVAPKKRKKIIENVSPVKKLGPIGSRYKIFSTAANPSAIIII